jgi:hypothetical protein
VRWCILKMCLHDEDERRALDDILNKEHENIRRLLLQGAEGEGCTDEWFISLSSRIDSFFALFIQ